MKRAQRQSISRLRYLTQDKETIYTRGTRGASRDMITVYGLRNCDTCRKARSWLDETGLVFRFHDFREDGLPEDAPAKWSDAVGWELLLNRRSTTWRSLEDADRSDLDAEKARQLMESHPTLIKRPVIETDGAVLVGFSDSVREALKNAAAR